MRGVWVWNIKCDVGLKRSSRGSWREKTDDKSVKVKDERLPGLVKKMMAGGGNGVESNSAQEWGCLAAKGGEAREVWREGGTVVDVGGALREP